MKACEYKSIDHSSKYETPSMQMQVCKCKSINPLMKACEYKSINHNIPQVFKDLKGYELGLGTSSM